MTDEPAGEEELTPDEEKAFEQMTQTIAHSLTAGAPKKTIVGQLVKKGFEEEVAVSLVEGVEQALENYRQSPEGRNVLASKYTKHMIYGLLWVVGGTVVSVTTRGAASGPGGGTYVVAWGAIVVGIVSFCRGLFGWLKCRI